MKNRLYLLLILSACFSCKSKSNQDTKDSTATSSINQTQDLIKKFKPIIQGVWVKADYVDKVIKTKSPLAASDEVGGITTMYINTDKLEGDSIIVNAGYGNHEGGSAVLKFQPGKSPATIIFNGGELSYTISNGDTTLTISQFDKTKKQQIITKYIKALNKQPDDDLGYGMSCYINKGLVVGSYALIDSTGEKSKVDFNSDGKVTGFFNFKKYIINIDLNSDVNDNLDEIGFDAFSKNRKSYGFKIILDTLKLYETLENVDSTELVLGKLKYKLVRQK
ncbi:MAG: hypothetical protein ACXVAY_21085 [Mucilaginibacter sp.]